MAQARGFAVVVTTEDPGSPRNGTRGRIVKQTLDHAPMLAEARGRSTVALHFEDGSRIPLEQIARIERAGD